MLNRHAIGVHNDDGLIGDGPSVPCPPAPRLKCSPFERHGIDHRDATFHGVRIRRNETLRADRGEYRTYGPAVHVGYACGVCQISPVIGTLYKNLSKEGKDVCGVCMSRYAVPGLYDVTDFADGESRHHAATRLPAATMAQMAPGLVPEDGVALGSTVPHGGEDGAYLRAPQLVDGTANLPAATNISQIPGVSGPTAVGARMTVRGGLLGNAPPPAARMVRGYSGARPGPPLSAAPQQPGATWQ